LNTEPEQ